MNRTIFEGFGLRIVRSAVGFVAEYDSGESAGSHLVRKAMSPDQAERTLRNEDSAWSVLLEPEGDAELPDAI